MKFLLVIGFLISNAHANQSLNGRYQVVFHPSIRADSLMIDTHTGRIWKDTCFKAADDGNNCALSAWQEQTTLGISVKEEAFFKTAAKIEKNKD